MRCGALQGRSARCHIPIPTGLPITNQARIAPSRAIPTHWPLLASTRPQTRRSTKCRLLTAAQTHRHGCWAPHPGVCLGLVRIGDTVDPPPDHRGWCWLLFQCDAASSLDPSSGCLFRIGASRVGNAWRGSGVDKHIPTLNHAIAKQSPPRLGPGRPALRAADQTERLCRRREDPAAVNPLAYLRGRPLGRGPNRTPFKPSTHQLHP